MFDQYSPSSLKVDAFIRALNQDHTIKIVQTNLEAVLYDIADLLGHSTTPGETRNTKVTRGYAHGVPKRLRDAVKSLEEGKLAILESAPTSRQVASTA